jgi:anti-sigma B factor antagonist
VVSVVGELDLATAPVLEETLLTLSETGQGEVIVDLARCDLIDMRGLHVLLSARAHLKTSERPLVLVAGNPDLLRVFKITRVDALFTIFPSMAAAAAGHAHG